MLGDGELAGPVPPPLLIELSPVGTLEPVDTALDVLGVLELDAELDGLWLLTGRQAVCTTWPS